MKTILAFMFMVARVAAADPAEASRPIAKTAAFYKAWEARDLGTLAGFFHPESLRGHRRYVEIAFLKLEKSYGEKAISAMLGKSKAELAAFSDREFFLFTMGAALQVAEASPLPKETGFRPIGEISDGPRIHTLVSFALVFAEGDRRLNLQRVDNLTFLREGGEWKVSSFPYASLVARIYTDELLKAARTVAEKRAR